MNKVLIVGRFVRDANVSTTSNGIKRAFFTVAVDRRTSAENQTDFVPCTAWRTDAEFIEKYLGKGSLVSVEGRFTSSEMKQPDGSIQTRYEVTVEKIQGLESKAQAEARKQSKTQEVAINSYSSQSKTKEIKFEEETKKSKSDDNESGDFDWDFES